MVLAIEDRNTEIKQQTGEREGISVPSTHIRDKEEQCESSTDGDSSSDVCVGSVLPVFPSESRLVGQFSAGSGPAATPRAAETFLGDLDRRH